MPLRHPYTQDAGTGIRGLFVLALKHQHEGQDYFPLYCFSR